MCIAFLSIGYDTFLGHLGKHICLSGYANIGRRVGGVYSICLPGYAVMQLTKLLTCMAEDFLSIRYDRYLIIYVNKIIMENFFEYMFRNTMSDLDSLVDNANKIVHRLRQENDNIDKTNKEREGKPSTNKKTSK